MPPWPPPPDVDSIKQLVCEADTEDFIANGSPADEYDGEAEALVAVIAQWPTAQLTAPQLLPVIEEIWAQSFACDRSSTGRPALLLLARQIARFFGPEARPHTRGSLP